MNKVNRHESSNQFCGPAVLSIVSGHTVDHCSQVLGLILNKAPKNIKGVFEKDLVEAGKRLRVKFIEVDAPGYTLFSQIRSIITKPGLYIAVLPIHYVAIEITADKKALFCDNHTKEPINAAASARTHQAVTRLWKCESKGNPVLISVDVEVTNHRLGGTLNFIEFNEVSKYIDPEDNTTSSLGSIRCTDNQLIVLRQRLLEINK